MLIWVINISNRGEKKLNKQNYEWGVLLSQGQNPSPGVPYPASAKRTAPANAVPHLHMLLCISLLLPVSSFFGLIPLYCIPWEFEEWDLKIKWKTWEGGLQIERILFIGLEYSTFHCFCTWTNMEYMEWSFSKFYGTSWILFLLLSLIKVAVLYNKRWLGKE